MNLGMTKAIFSSSKDGIPKRIIFPCCAKETFSFSSKNFLRISSTAALVLAVSSIFFPAAIRSPRIEAKVLVFPVPGGPQINVIS